MDVKTTIVDLPAPVEHPPLPNPEPITTQDFSFRVLTTDMEVDRVYYAVTPEAYKVMARNMAEILRWVRESKFLLDYYRGEHDGVPVGEPESE